MGLRAIARELGCSRTTVKRYVRDEAAGRYAPRQPRPTKLDTHKSYLLERIEAARPRWIPAVVLLREIRERGYAGGVTQLKAFINPLKQAKTDPVVRFETPPGEQMQADFTVIRRGRDPLLGFVATLGYSRATWVRFTPGEDAATLCGCVREALQFFGGAPRHVLFDNAKTIVVDRDAYGAGQHRWHSGLLALADEYGFGLKVFRPYRAKTKGKVERFNGVFEGELPGAAGSDPEERGTQARRHRGHAGSPPAPRAHRANHRRELSVEGQTKSRTDESSRWRERLTTRQ
jgi:transposase